MGMGKFFAILGRNEAALSLAIMKVSSSFHLRFISIKTREPQKDVFTDEGRDSQRYDADDDVFYGDGPACETQGPDQMLDGELMDIVDRIGERPGETQKRSRAIAIMLKEGDPGHDGSEAEEVV